MSNQEKYDAKVKRIMDATALKEPDTVPFNPILQCYPFVHAGHTMADILYDVDAKIAEADLLKYVEEYDPDNVMGQDYVNIGQGPIFEKTHPKTIMWAGMPNGTIDKNSIHQYIEFPILLDDEIDMFMNDRVNWFLTRGIGRTQGIFEAFKVFDVRNMNPYTGTIFFSQIFSNPEMRKMIETMWEVGDMMAANGAAIARMNAAVEEAGYPCLMRGMAAVPFDTYSDFYRGTVAGLMDLYENPDEVYAYCEEELEKVLEMVRMQGQFLKGKLVFMALHKGMDGFMSEEHYVKYYWNHLQKIIECIIENDMVPYIYTEGAYTTRLKHLAEVPAGKVIYHFETVDLKKAKEILGDVACIAGGFNTPLLDRKTPAEIKEEVKRILDIVAPGGGYIFETSCGIDYALPENVEAMTEAVREYGKY